MMVKSNLDLMVMTIHDHDGDEVGRKDALILFVYPTEKPVIDKNTMEDNE